MHGYSLDRIDLLDSIPIMISSSITKFEPMCNSTCLCDMSKFSPVCGADGLIYFSSCHAGCSLSTNGKFSNCDCISNGKTECELGLGMLVFEFVIFLFVEQTKTFQTQLVDIVMEIVKISCCSFPYFRSLYLCIRLRKWVACY